ncbi:MAG: cyclic nucleotide-binding domain-containing protein [Phaeodactylibacter sp.]|nr:cyclic nucleotide-binding domain-containing protein [Phaeodactylibacter sp.]
MNALDLLKDVPYFKNLDEKALQELLIKGDMIQIRCGHPLMQQGDASDEAYILLDGRLRAILEKEGEEHTILGEIGRGEIVGELAALFGGERSATIIALRNSTLLRLGREDFVRLLQEQQGSLLHLTHTILKRASRSFSPNNGLSAVALVPATPNLSLDAFCHELAKAAARHTSVALLTSAIAGQKLGGKIPVEGDELESLLAQYEDEHNLVLYQADPKWNKWTEACLSRADKIIWVADAEQSPEPCLSERRLTQACLSINHAAHELVLLHPSHNQYPTGTRHWLAERNLSRHFHIARDHSGDIQRLARFLTGNAIGVALSTGGMRASVQFGILHAMIEGGIPVDIIGGSSGGAFIGGVFAQIIAPDEFPRIVKEGEKLFKDSTKLTLPLVSLYSGRKFTQIIKALTHSRNIEDLWIDYFCLSLSLVNGSLVIHKEGPMWEAIRASAAVYGILPPLIKDSDCLVDGGLINACPTDLIAKMGAGKTIAVIASSKSGITVDGAFSPDVSGWDILLKKLNPLYRKKIKPSITANIIQSMLIASDHLQDRIYNDSSVDLFIHPPIGAIPSMDIQSLSKLYRFGYEYGLAHVEKWKEVLNTAKPD